MAGVEGLCDCRTHYLSLSCCRGLPTLWFSIGLLLTLSCSTYGELLTAVTDCGAVEGYCHCCAAECYCHCGAVQGYCYCHSLWCSRGLLSLWCSRVLLSLRCSTGLLVSRGCSEGDIRVATKPTVTLNDISWWHYLSVKRPNQPRPKQSCE